MSSLKQNAAVNNSELIHGELHEVEAPSRLHREIVSELVHEVSDFMSSQGISGEVHTAPFAVDLFGNGSAIVRPDLTVVCDRSKLTDKDYSGAPDFVIELVSPTSRKLDYLTKQALYGDAGVREYWIVDPSMSRTTVTRFEKDPAPLVYSFATPVEVGVIQDLRINLEAIVQEAQ